jgi:hypothetical protein
MKHLKIFEQYTEEYLTESEIANSVFEDWMVDNEDDIRSLSESLYAGDEEEIDWSSDDDERELTSGEKAALKRDFQIISRPQLAALYLRALGKLEEEPGKFLVMINGMLPFGEYDKDSREFYVSIPALADAIGLDSTRTVTRTVRKFYNILSGEGDTHSEAIYPKIIEASKVFSRMSPQEIATMASEAIQNSEEFTKNRDKAKSELSVAAAKRASQKADQLKLGDKVHSLIKSLRSIPAFRDLGKAERMAVSKLADEMGLTPERVSLAYRMYKKDKGIEGIY